jgi:hypothetical protein
MIKAGLGGVVVGFIYVMSLTLVSPLCTFCFTPLLGLAVGYLAGRLAGTANRNSSLAAGLVAGAMAGLAAMLGQMLATVVNGILVTHWEQLPLFMTELGFPQISNNNEYWQTTLAGNAFCGLLNLAIIVGLSGLGSLIWFQRYNRRLLSAV